MVPRSGLRKALSNFFEPTLDRQIDSLLETTLSQLLDCPPKAARNTADATDLAIDVIVPEYDCGEFSLPNWAGYFVPLVWRPSITVTGRLYVIDSGETISKATVKHSVGWLSFGRKVVSPPKLLGFQSYMTDADMERMTTEAAVKLLSKL